MKVFSEEEVQRVLSEHPLWKWDRQKIVRDWVFADFLEAMEFVQKVAALAETANHHPDIDIRYNRVRLALISHDAGGLTTRDAAMARTIDQHFPDSGTGAE